MPTLKQRKAFNLAMESMKGENSKTKGEILREAGYDELTSLRPSQVWNSQGFRGMLAEIDDSLIVSKWYEWALSDIDKRVALQAGENILKLKNRFPKEQIDIELSKKRESLVEA